MATNQSTTRLNSGHGSPNFRRTRSNGGIRSQYNPLIVLRGRGANNRYELHYDDGSGSGIQPLPENVQSFVLNSGMERILHQLNVGGTGGASGKAIGSMPVVRIVEDHVNCESHCAVCKEKFELDCEARELPCKHIYHLGCILPWLRSHCTCPVCRFELPKDGEDSGMLIWRMPSGGFAIGEFDVNGGEEIEVPGVYTELDAGFERLGGPGRLRTNFVTWEEYARIVRENGGHGGRGLDRVFNRFLSFLGRSSDRNGLLGSGFNSGVYRFPRTRRRRRWTPWSHVNDN